MSKNTTAINQNATTITTIGIDLAKNLFAVHGADASGKPVLVRPNVRREQLLELLAQLRTRAFPIQLGSLFSTQHP